MKKDAADVGSLFMSKTLCSNCSETTKEHDIICASCSHILPFQIINPFYIFNQSISMQINKSGLNSKYFELQKQLHPDKLLFASNAQKELAAQHIVQINEGYKALKNPLTRAKSALLALQSLTTSLNDFDKNIQLPKPTNTFLQKVMSLQMNPNNDSNIEMLYQNCMECLSTSIEFKSIEKTLHNLSEFTYLTRLHHPHERVS